MQLNGYNNSTCVCMICQSLPSQNLAGDRTIRPLLVHFSLDGGTLTSDGATFGISLVTAGAESSIVNDSTKVVVTAGGFSLPVIVYLQCVDLFILNG